MATLDQIAQALQAADAAGDTQAATQLAQAYQQAKAQGQTPQAQQDPSMLSQAGQFGKEMLQSGGRMINNAVTGIPGVFADGTAQAYNYVHGRNAPTLQQTAAGQPGDYPFSVLPSQDWKNRLAPVLGQRPDGAAGIAEDVGSAVIGSKIPLPGQAASAPAQAAPQLATRAQQLQTLADAGVQVDSHQALSGRLALDLKNAANDGAYGSSDAFRTAQNSQFTSAALRQMGVNAREATPVIMRGGKIALQQTYNAIANRTSMELDTPLAQDLDNIRDGASQALTAENAAVISGKVESLLTMFERNGSRLSGTQYQKFQSDLNDIAKDGGKAPFVTQLRQAVTGLMQRQASPGDAQLLQQTNQRYGAMKSIQKAVDSNNQVSPSALYNAMDTQASAAQSVFGQGSNTRLMDLAQAGRSILGTNTANSGTPQRLAGMLAVGQAGAAATALATGHTDVAAGLTATALAAGFSQKAAQALVYTAQGRQYLQGLARAQQRAAGLAAAFRPNGAGGAINGAAAAIGSQQTADSTSP